MITSNLKSGGRLEDVLQFLLLDGDAASVHILQQQRHVLGGDVLQLPCQLHCCQMSLYLYKDHGMFGWVRHEQRSEVRTAGGEDQLVGLEGGAGRCETDVSEALLHPEGVEDVE